MKFFKNVKGLAVALLALALVCTAFATNKAHAGEENTTKYTATFTYTNEKSEKFVYKVDDAASTKTVKASDVLAKLAKGDTLLNANGEYVLDSITLDGGSEVDLTKDIPLTTDANTAYTVVVKAAFGVIEYDPINDVVIVNDVDESIDKLYVGALKTATAGKISKATVVNKPASESAITIKLNDKNAGVKVAENKDVFLFISTINPDKKVEYAPNFAIKANAGKLGNVVINYAVAGSEAIAVSGIKLDNTDLSDTTTPKLADTIAKLTVSVDGGTTWFESIEDFNGVELAKYLTGKTKVKAQFRIQGENKKDGDYNATRGTKVKAVSVAKAAKAPKLKIDYAKGTVSIGNLYDYYVSAEKVATPSAIALDEWITIIPFNKSGTAKKVDMHVSEYVPQAKVTESNLAFYTATKVKSLYILDLNDGSKGYVYARKSATAKKPASEIAEIQLPEVASGAALTLTDGAYGVSGEKAEGKKVNCVGKGTTALEYLVIDKDDLDKIDFASVKWTKFTAEKGLSDAAKSTYTPIGATEKKSVTVTTDGKTYVLVRGAGDKKASKLPTDYVITKLITGKVTVSGKEVDGIKWVPVE